MIKISLIASSVRPWLWMEFLDSLKSNKDYEVVFAGDLTTFQVRPFLSRYPELRYIHTKKEIPPCQCYEIARRNSVGELINWTADDCEYDESLLDNVYDFYKSINNPKAVISIKTNENNSFNELDDHCILGFNRETPLMAPLGVMSREYLDNLGGFDSRYCAGQYENKAVMMVYEDGGQVYKYEKGCVRIEHLKKHGKGTHFWKPYDQDRLVLENDYVIGEKPTPESNGLPYGLVIKQKGLGAPTLLWDKGIQFDTRKVSNKSMTGFKPFPNKDLTEINYTGREWPPVG